MSLITNKILSLILVVLSVIAILVLKGYTYESYIQAAKNGYENIQLVRTAMKDERVQEIFKDVKRAAGIETYRMPLFITESSTPNAYANFKQQVFFTRGMLELLEYDDDAIAAVLAHEIAHHMLMHTTYLEIMQSNAFTQGMYWEYMADVLSIPIVNAAGYDPCAAATIWEKFTHRFGHDVLSHSHPNFDVRKNYILRMCGGL